ncbi:MAG: RNA polymerase sigma24 factor [Candidatus Binatia bacterium]|nr:MAG: RNA polymerase sigma24 factor [Candidatus Binatia bacterium]
MLVGERVVALRDDGQLQRAMSTPSGNAKVGVTQGGSHPPSVGAETEATLSAVEDTALVERLLAGDEETFTALVDRYHAAMIRLAMVFLPSRAVAEEVVQETWLSVLQGLEAFEGRSTLKTWIFRILTNRAKTRAVREGRSVPFSAMGSEDSEYEPAVDPDRFESNGVWKVPPHPWRDNAPERLAMQQQALRTLREALDDLPPNQRAVLTLRDIEGLDAVEVCNILGISDTNQRVLLHRARAKMRAVLERYLE